MAGGTGVDNHWMIAKCQELLKSFNPVTHSIDTHCLEALGDVHAAVNLPHLANSYETM